MSPTIVIVTDFTHCVPQPWQPLHLRSYPINIFGSDAYFKIIYVVVGLLRGLRLQWLIKAGCWVRIATLAFASIEEPHSYW